MNGRFRCKELYNLQLNARICCERIEEVTEGVLGNLKYFMYLPFTIQKITNINQMMIWARPYGRCTETIFFCFHYTLLFSKRVLEYNTMCFNMLLFYA